MAHGYRFGGITEDEGAFIEAQHPTLEQGKVLEKLEKARAGFYNSVMQYKTMLEQTTAAKGSGSREQELQQRMFAELNASAGELEDRNVGEAYMGLVILALNSGFTLRDRLNDLGQKEVRLYRKICEVEATLAEINKKLDDREKEEKPDGVDADS